MRSITETGKIICKMVGEHISGLNLKVKAPSFLETDTKGNGKTARDQEPEYFTMQTEQNI